MPAATRQQARPASLAVQAARAEAQVMRHRRLVRVRASMLGQKLRGGLTSPAVLLMAGGLGFLAERCTRQRTSVPDSTRPPGVADSGPFATMLKLVGLFGTLMRSVPPVAANSSFDPANSADRF